MARRRLTASTLEAVRPLDRPGPLRKGVLDSLRELIATRTLLPGQHLVESELATRLNVSRGPVREAFQALQAQGWVELRPGRGAFVRRPTDDEVDEVFAVRAPLESEAAALAAARVQAADLAELQEICRRGRLAFDADDEAAVVTANSELHRRIADLSGISLLSSYVDELDLRVRWFFRPVVRTRGRDSWDEHERLIDALARHDCIAAAALMREHTEHTRQAYRLVAAQPHDSAEPG
jgi:DNA-binding GntR family transcriptional regulator